MTEIRPTELPDVLEIIPPRYGDERGFFTESWNKERLKSLGIDIDFCQDNHSFSRDRGVLRGLHFQRAPKAQSKLVRVIEGAALDVAVDIRKGSPTYLKWVGVELSAEKGNQLLIPNGFAHGFVTLTENTHFLYKVSVPYSKEEDRSVRFDDPDIGIEWPIATDTLTLSPKDMDAPFLKDSDNNFVFQGSR